MDLWYLFCLHDILAMLSSTSLYNLKTISSISVANSSHLFCGGWLTICCSSCGHAVATMRCKLSLRHCVSQSQSATHAERSKLGLHDLFSAWNLQWDVDGDQSSDPSVHWWQTTFCCFSTRWHMSTDPLQPLFVSFEALNFGPSVLL